MDSELKKYLNKFEELNKKEQENEEKLKRYKEKLEFLKKEDNDRPINNEAIDEVNNLLNKLEYLEREFLASLINKFGKVGLEEHIDNIIKKLEDENNHEFDRVLNNISKEEFKEQLLEYKEILK